MFKSKVQPLCRYCGKAIRKRTITVRLKPEPTGNEHPMEGFSRYIFVGSTYPRTKAECQRLTNHAISAVRRYQPIKGVGLDWDEKTGESYIEQFTEWDGESYNDEFFCTGECAKNFGYMIASTSNTVTKAYNEAIRKRRDNDEENRIRPRSART